MTCGHLKIFWILLSIGDGEVGIRKNEGGGFIAFVPLNLWAGPTEIPEDAGPLESGSPGHCALV